MNSFTISRTFNAPRKLVFECWTDPAHFEKWFFPEGCVSSLVAADVSPGGSYRQRIKFPDGVEFLVQTAFREISPIDFILAITSFIGENGETVKHPFVDLWPDYLLLSVRFEDDGPGTKISVIWEPLDASKEEADEFVANQNNCALGWTGTFNNLEGHLSDLAATRT